MEITFNERYIIVDYYTGDSWQGITRYFSSYRDALHYASDYSKDMQVYNPFIIKKL